MRLHLILGMNKSITVEHLEEELYEVVAEERCKVEAKVGDMVMRTNVGWVIFRDKDCSIPRYRLPSQNVKEVEMVTINANGIGIHEERGEEE
tara:strand:+ start:224 stop:499 length:276 start_codon:yes stop_codon:yes gene_type:complete